MSSAYDYIENLKNDPKNKIIHFNNFIDCFYSLNEDEKKLAVAEEPNDYQDIDEVDYVFLTSSVHYLCNSSNITPPEWVFKEKYKLKEPYFSNNEQSKYKNYLLIYSPPEFKYRNMFVAPNVLSRI